MPYSFYKIATISLIALSVITACGSNDRYKREVNDNESYLEEAELKPLVIPDDVRIQPANPEYNVNVIKSEGFVGKQLDVRPPAQPLAVLEGSSATYKDGVVIFTAKAGYYSWAQVLNILTTQSILYRNVDQDVVQTDYIALNQFDNASDYRARYEIAFVTENSNEYLLVKLMDLQLQQDNITVPSEIQRYTVLMFNNIVLQLATNNQYAKRLEAQDNIGTKPDNNSAISVQSGTDENGFPIITLRSSFNDTWGKIQKAFNLMGIKIVKQERSKGMMEVEYDGSINKQLESAGAQNLPLTRETYQVALGDLTNRTTVQFSTKENSKFLTDEQNRIVAFVLQEALKQSSSQ